MKISSSPEVERLMVEIMEQAASMLALKIRNKYPTLKGLPDWLLFHMATINPSLMLGQPNELESGWAKTRFEVFRRDNFTCKYCGRRVIDGVRLTVDHVTPRSKSGTSTIDNLITSCESCNSAKGDEELTEEEKILLDIGR